MVSTEGATFEVEQLGLLARTLDHRVLRGPASLGSDDPYGAIALFPSDLTLQGGSRSQTLHGLRGTLYGDAQAAKLDLEFSLPAAHAEAKPGRFTVSRKRAASPPETVWHVTSGGHAFPCAVLQDLAPPLARLGPDCSFTGDLRWVDSPSGSSGGIAGSFSGIDLDALVTEQFAHQLSGIADVEIASAAVSHGKLSQLAGTLRARNGAISPSLLAAAQEHLGLEVQIDLPSESGRPVAFDELALAFQLDGRSLHLSSARGEPGIFLSGPAGPLVAARPNHAVAAVNLLRALLPDNQFQVPATRQTGTLVSLLPVPDLEPGHTAALPAHTPTRLLPSSPTDAAPVLRQPGLR
jgi:hypothetical protein